MSHRDAGLAAKLIQRAKARDAAAIKDLSFRIGPDQRRVTLGKDGTPKAGKPKAPRRNPNAGLKTSGMRDTRVQVRRR